MRTNTSRSRRGLGIACAAAIATLGLVGAAPAKAGDEFANGFEDQLGRIVAHQAVNLGFFLLSGGAYHHPYPRHAYTARYEYRRPYQHYRKHRRRSYVPPRRVYRHYGHAHDDYDEYNDCDDGRVVYERRSRYLRGLRAR